MTVLKFTGKFRYPRQIKPREIWKSPEPSNLMVWDVCPYVDKKVGLDDGCQHCPAWEDSRRGKVKRGCRALAEEVCRIVMAAQRLEKVHS